MFLGLRAADDVQHANISRNQGVGYQRTVAAPGHGFRAHENKTFLASQFDGLLQTRDKIRSLHVVGIPSKTCIAPAKVRGIGARMAQPAQLLQVNVTDLAAMELLRERFAVELRIVPGLGNGANVGDLLDTVRLKQLKKFADRMCGMADRIDAFDGVAAGLVHCYPASIIKARIGVARNFASSTEADGDNGAAFPTGAYASFRVRRFLAEVTTLFWDNGGVILTNGWDRGSRKKAVAQFALDWDDFEDRHELMLNAFENGEVTLDEYLRRTVFYRERGFTPEQFKRFMFDQSQPFPESLAFLGKLAATRRYLMAALNNESSKSTITASTPFDCGITLKPSSAPATWACGSPILASTAWRSRSRSAPRANAF